MRWHIQFTRYAIIGLISNFVCYGLYLLMTYFGMGHKAAMTLLYAVGVMQTFFFNRNWSFKHDGRISASMLRYISAYAFGYAFNLVVLMVLVDRWGWPHQWVQGVMIIVLAGMLFLLQRYWVFADTTTTPIWKETRINHWTTPGILILVAAALRLYDLGGESFWVDEGWSAYMGHLGQWSAWQVNEHPPLFYALVSAWIQVADDDLWLRLLPAVFGISTIPLVYLTGTCLFDRHTGTAAAGFMAIDAFHVRYSRDLTMYSLEVFLFTAALLAVAHIATARHSNKLWIWWGVYVVAAALLCWSQALAPLYVGIVGLVLPIMRRDFGAGGLWKPWLLAHGLIVLGFLPWLPTYFLRAQSVVEDFWITQPSAWAPWQQIFEFTVASIPSLQERLGLGPGRWIWAAPMYSLVALALWRGVVDRDRSIMALATMLIIPIAAIYLLSIAIRPIMIPRQMIPVIVPLVLLLAVSCTRLLPSVHLRKTAIFVVSLLLLMSSVFHLRYMQKENWRGAAYALAEHIRPGDTVLFNTYGDFHGYLMGRYVPKSSFSETHFVYLYPLLRQCRSGHVTQCLDEGVFRFLASDSTCWIVESHQNFVPHPEQVRTWLDMRFEKIMAKKFEGIKVWKGKPVS